MPAPPASQPPDAYFLQLSRLILVSFEQLVGPPLQSDRAKAAQHLMRQIGRLSAAGAVLIVVLMIGFDTTEIGLMPPRGTPGLWPLRILTDFGKDAYVISVLAVTLLAIAVVLPESRARARAALLRFGGRIEYLLLAVLVPVLVTQILKWVVGRGRPFIGGKANPFNFAPFSGTEAYFSFPSSHAVTAFALAFGVAAIWPRARWLALAYAVIIALTRLVLLAHHPSDVVGGAVIGIVGAAGVQYWFAVRRIAFTVDREGAIVPR
ncbi:phosphatase PAP2 family protein [Bradyrhizobium sp.]|uniref:phosphatase PAP2 family protein n=1 Tax=Bradyrhizobium sp. TaxID=376 RepID=UPI001EB940D9|nr:phosphatase PAP2 family protein [Bradyrhizobium sp.]MBV8922266.1 phosphatase PAP2 family protein [Bradyrhizobium sp.]MBV9983130.1 phosphatase PAP2 family protein [Bradyrhizobium sp.]